MYRVPPDRAWWPAVGAPLERGVRQQCGRQREEVQCATAATDLGEREKTATRCALTKLADVWICLPPLPKQSEATARRTAVGPKN